MGRTKKIALIEEQLMQKKKAFEKEVKPLREERERLEKEFNIARNTDLIGKCFKMKNSYGANEPRWWHYSKIIGITSDGYMVEALEIQKILDEDIEIKIDSHTPSLYTTRTSINPSEFNEKFEEYIKELKQKNAIKGD